MKLKESFTYFVAIVFSIFLFILAIPFYILDAISTKCLHEQPFFGVHDELEGVYSDQDKRDSAKLE